MLKGKQKNLDLKNSTFHNFNITNKKSNIASKVNEMDVSENRNIKLINTFFLPSHIKSNKLIMKNDNDKSNKNDMKKIPINRKHSNILKKIALIKRNKMKQYSSFEEIQNRILISMYKNNLKRQKYLSSNKNYKNAAKLLNKIVKFNLSTNNKENIINSHKVLKPIMIQKDRNNNLNNLEKNSKMHINSEEKNMNNKKNVSFSNNDNINNIKKSSNISPYNKYYLTVDHFSSIKENKKNKELSNNTKKEHFLNKTKFNKNLFQTKSLNSNNLQLPNTITNTSHNYNKTTNNNSFDGRNINKYKTKKIPRVNLNYWKLLELENKFNTVYNDNCLDINEQNKIIKQVKEKCKILLEEIDKKNNFEIQHIMKEIQEQLLSFGFKDFFRYLLTILKNYDKKIVDWSFDIVEDQKECPEELKFKNVRNRHKQFMGMLNRQYVCGVNANNHMDHLIKNAKNALGFNNQKYYDNIILNNNNSQDHFIENLFTENNYRSKFFDTFLRNKNK